MSNGEEEPSGPEAAVPTRLADVPVPVPPRPRPPAPATPSPPVPPTEEKLMEELRRARDVGQHGLAIQLAREGNRRFPDSALAPERESILIHALADDEQRSESRGQAEYMVNHYPDSEWVREIERYTGAHRHRNVRVDDAGQLQFSN
jgi:hypothetical protein